MELWKSWWNWSFSIVKIQSISTSLFVFLWWMYLCLVCWFICFACDWVAFLFMFVTSFVLFVFFSFRLSSTKNLTMWQLFHNTITMSLNFGGLRSVWDMKWFNDLIHVVHNVLMEILQFFILFCFVLFCFVLFCSGSKGVFQKLLNFFGTLLII